MMIDKEKLLDAYDKKVKEVTQADDDESDVSLVIKIHDLLLFTAVRCLIDEQEEVEEPKQEKSVEKATPTSDYAAAEKWSLRDTADAMVSSRYQIRFTAEYAQTYIRYVKLKRMLKKADNGDLEFTPTCNRGLLQKQAAVMADYLCILETRAQIEGIVLPDIDVE